MGAQGNPPIERPKDERDPGWQGSGRVTQIEKVGWRTGVRGRQCLPRGVAMGKGKEGGGGRWPQLPLGHPEEGNIYSMQ